MEVLFIYFVSYLLHIMGLEKVRTFNYRKGW